MAKIIERKAEIWQLLTKLGVYITPTGQVTLEIHVKECEMKDAYITIREKVKS